jgi:hypothetical protein
MAVVVPHPQCHHVFSVKPQSSTLEAMALIRSVKNVLMFKAEPSITTPTA